MLRLFLVFLASIVIDWIWASYIMYTSKKEAGKAALLSSLIIIIGAFTTVSYLEDKRAIIVMIFGGFIGTYVSIKMNKN